MGARALRVVPRGFEDVFALARAIGEALERRDAAQAWVRRTRRGLAALSADSLGQPRPHVAALVSLDPPVVAGGASLESELIEVAGAESATHGLEEHRIGLGELPEDHRTPALWLVIVAHETDSALDLAEALLPAGAPVALLALPEGWWADPIGAAERLRALILLHSPT